MGLTIKYRRKIFFYLLAISALTGCNVKDRLHKGDKIVFKQYFKQNVFERCLFYGFNKSNDYKKAISINRLGGAEFLVYSEDIIDSIAKVQNYIMVQDSINSIGKTAEGTQGKKVFAQALAYFTSKSLDSLANKEYQKFKQKRGY